MSLLEVLGLNLGNLNLSLTLDSRSAGLDNSVLSRRDPTVVLPRNEAAVNLHESLIAARDLAASVDVPTAELEDILEKLRSLEGQVEGLLGDEDDVVEVNTIAGDGDGDPDDVNTVSGNGDGLGGGDGGDESESITQNSATDSDDEDETDGSGSSAGGAVFKQKVKVEEEVVTSTMGDSTSTITKTRTTTTTITKTTDDPEESMTEAPVEPSPEPSPEPMETSSEPSTPASPPANVRLGAAFKEASPPFRTSNATAVAMNAAMPNTIPGDVVSAPSTMSAPPTSLPVPAVKQFYNAVYTNTSVRTGFQTVTLPAAQ